MKEVNAVRLQNLVDILTGKRREQFQNLMEYLKDHSSYFTAPASPMYHCSWEEGLLEHSLNVADVALTLNRELKAGLNEEELVVCALMHDLGKAYIGHNTPYYVFNEPTDNQKKYGYVQDKRYKYNNDSQVFMTVPQRAVRVVTQFVDISDMAYQAILIHDGPYVAENSPYSCKENPMALILHMADSWSGFIIEGVTKKSDDGKGYVEYVPEKADKYGDKVRVSQTTGYNEENLWA